MTQKLFKTVDNAPLVLFRIFFGIVFIFESFGAIATGWVKSNLVEPKTNFTFIGFEFLLNLMGNYMYVHFVVMGLFSIGVALGYKYRFSIIALTIMWASVYFMQKTSYNNHYYLMLLIAGMLCFLPANRYASIDVKNNPKLKKNYMPQWISWAFIIQISVVYVFATLAKFYPDWLNGTVTSNMFASIQGPEFLTNILHDHTFHLFIAYSGILFDGLIVPALLFKRTRKIAVVLSLIFHIFNSIALQIGVFPYFALTFCMFFFPADDIRKIFFKRKEPLGIETPAYDFEAKKTALYLFIPYLIIQVLLPIRHWFIKGDVLWTEEGHRLSWRMMLRSRSGVTTFRVIDKKNNEILNFAVGDFLTPKQNSRLNTPDMIWQMAQKIKTYYKFQGKDVAVYAKSSYVSINSKENNVLIDPKVDLANEKWNHFKHHDWILDENVQLKNR